MGLLAAFLLPTPAGAQLCDWYYAQTTAAALVPPLESEARAEFYGTFDNCGPCTPERDQTFSISVHDLVGFSGPPSAVRLHSGRPTENGPLIYDWPIPDPTHAALPFDVTFGSEYCAELSDTLLYVVIATAAHPEGEARGQLLYEQASPILKMTWGRIRVLFR
jgi:hypothetical protein